MLRQRPQRQAPDRDCYDANKRVPLQEGKCAVGECFGLVVAEGVNGEEDVAGKQLAVVGSGEEGGEELREHAEEPYDEVGAGAEGESEDVAEAEGFEDFGFELVGGDEGAVGVESGDEDFES